MKWIGWTAGLLGVVTAIAGVNLALLNYTPIPFADQIDFFRGFYKVDGWEGYSFKQLYVRHNEHRILVPRLWFLADIAWFDGRQILTIGTILVSAVLHAVLLTALFRGLGQRGWVVMVFLLMAVGAVLSPVQWENLIWGFQVQFIQVWLFATLAFALIAWTPLAEKHGVLRGSMILFALLAAFASTYSMVNGLLVWPLLLLLAWWRRLPTWAVALIGLIGGAVIAVEVTGFSVHAGHGDPRDTLLQPLGLVRYAARYLMSSASAIGPLGQEILGGLLMAYTLVMALWSLLQRDRFRPSHGALLAVAGFIVGAAFLTGLGRLPFGLDQASGSRYATPSLVFLLAVSALILHQIRSYDRRRWHALALGFGSILLLLPGLVDGSKVLPTLIGQRDARKNAVSAYLVSGYQPDTLSAIYPGWPAIPQRVFDQLFADGIGPFAVSEQFKPRAVLGDRIPLPVKACRGYVDGASYDPVGGVRVIGWAAAKESIDQPIWVLVTDRRDRIVAWGPSGVRRDDVGAAIGLGWRARGFEAYGPWSADAEGAVNAIGVFSDDSRCRIGQGIELAPPRFIESLDTTVVSAMTEPWRVVEGDADADGAGSVPPPEGAGPAIGNFGQTDARFVAEATMAASSSTALLALPVRTGDYPIEVRVELLAGGDGDVIDQHDFGRPSAPEWHWLLLRVPADQNRGSADFRLRVSTPGRQDWQAIAIGSPVWVPADDDG